MYSPRLSRSAGRYAAAIIPLGLILLSGLALFGGTPSAQAQTSTTTTTSTAAACVTSGTNSTVDAAQTGYVANPPPDTVAVTKLGGILVYAANTPYNTATGQEGTYVGEPVAQPAVNGSCI